MTHDQECKFDPKYCRDCKLQAEARADERKKFADILVGIYAASMTPPPKQKDQKQWKPKNV